MSRRAGRGITADERALWRQVVSDAEPIDRQSPEPKTERSAPAPQAEAGQPKSGPAVRRAVVSAPANSGKGAGGLAMDHKAWRRMTRGKLAPEARLDLHGLTLAQAQPRLQSFILGAVSRECRLVLVITGKGRGDQGAVPLPVRPGALRHAVPHWLRMPPLAGHVLEVAQAHQRHGGAGAYYVYLRRKR